MKHTSVKMTDSELLESICKKCLIVNGHCIKDYPYMGLCAENDKEEILDSYRERRGGVKSGS